MSTSSSHDRSSRAHLNLTDSKHSVTSLELFFDLVFVFALTQVTSLIAADLTPLGMLRGVLVLAVMWWSWVGYSWLTNFVRADDGAPRFLLITVMGVMMVMALAIPEAFRDAGEPSPNGALVFALGYLAVRALHIALFALAGRGDPGLLGTLLRFSLPTVFGVGLIVTAAFTTGPWQLVLWVAALTVDLIGVLVIDSGGWRLNSPSHFAERHSLIIIIALGESIVAIGAGMGGLPLTWPALLATALGMVVVISVWWTYFDFVSTVAERMLASKEGAERTAMARDSYTYLHFPMVAGIVLIALGLKKALSKAAEATAFGDVHALPDIALWSLCGGTAAYLGAQVAFRWRNTHTWGVQRPLATAAVLVVPSLLGNRNSLVQVGVIALILLAVVGYESVRLREFRAELRHAEH